MILVPGGAGYIGSHTVVELLNSKFKFYNFIYTGTKQTASLLLEPIIVDKSNIEETIKSIKK